MKRLLLYLFAFMGSIFLVAIFTGSSVAQGYSRDILIKNNTGEDIAGLYMTPHGWQSWGHNILTNTLEDRDTVYIHFSGFENRCKFDIKVDFSNGYSETWGLSRTGENLCKDYGIEIEDNGSITRVRQQAH